MGMGMCMAMTMGMGTQVWVCMYGYAGMGMGMGGMQVWLGMIRPWIRVLSDLNVSICLSNHDVHSDAQGCHEPVSADHVQREGL